MAFCCTARPGPSPKEIEAAFAADKSIVSLRPLLKQRSGAAEKDVLIRMLGRTFAGQANSESEPVVNYMLGPSLALTDPETGAPVDPGQHPDPERHCSVKGTCSEERFQTAAFLMSFPFYTAALYPKLGFVIADTERTASLGAEHLRDVSLPGVRGSAAGSAEVQAERRGVIFGKVYPQGYRRTRWELLEIFRVVAIETGLSQLPPVLKDNARAAERKELEKRLDRVKIIETKHAEFCPEPHIYVNCVSVHPDEQGKGVCSIVMKAVCRLGDRLQLPCYLECAGQRRKAVYGRYGFEEVGRVTMDGPETAAPNWPGVEYIAMKRQPSTALSSPLP